MVEFGSRVTSTKPGPDCWEGAGAQPEKIIPQITNITQSLNKLRRLNFIDVFSSTLYIWDAFYGGIFLHQYEFWKYLRTMSE